MYTQHNLVNFSYYFGWCSGEFFEVIENKKNSKTLRERGVNL